MIFLSKFLKKWQGKIEFNFRKIDNVEILNSLTQFTDLWESQMIYANNFMSYLRKMINGKLQYLQKNVDESIKASKKLVNDLNLISRKKLCVKNIELDIQEENIR